MDLELFENKAYDKFVIAEFLLQAKEEDLKMNSS